MSEENENEAAISSPVVSARAPSPVGPYPHARRVGGMLFLSGIGPRRPGTDEIPGVERDGDGRIISYDIEAQVRSTIENIRAILEDGGSSLENVVDVLVFLTDMDRDFPTFNRVYAEYFGEIRPARTTVGVTSLPTPIAVELKVVAMVRGSRLEARGSGVGGSGVEARGSRLGAPESGRETE